MCKKNKLIAWLATALFAGTAAMVAAPLQAETIRVAGVYTQPIQQKWDARLHMALQALEDAGDIEYEYSEKVANTDYVRVLREYAEGGVDLIVGEAFGISREARKVADDYPGTAFLMGDPSNRTALISPCSTITFTSRAT